MSSSSSSSSSSLYANHAAILVGQRNVNAIHNALDNQQYTKAIRLCLEFLSISSPTSIITTAATAAVKAAVTTTSNNNNNNNNSVLTPSQGLNVLVLLTHAYAKAGQKYRSVSTILQLFGCSEDTNTTESATTTTTSTIMMFPELQLYMKYARYEKESLNDSDDVASPSSSSSSSLTYATKKSQTYKKKGTTSGQPQPQPQQSSTLPIHDTANTTNTMDSSVADLSTIWDWIDQLMIPPIILSQHCSESSPALLVSQQLHTIVLCFDSSIISTLGITLQHILKFPYTAYQIYMWAFQTVLSHPTASRQPQNYEAIQMYGHHAYMLGVGLLAVPQYQNIHSMLLTQLQVLAIQMTRIQQQQQLQQQLPLTLSDPTNATTTTEYYCTMLWAAQIALWKYTLLPPPSPPKVNENHQTPSQQQQRDMLLRLAESMAMKCIEMYSHVYQNKQQQQQQQQEMNHMEQYNQISPTQSYLLYIRTLQLQKKYNDIVQYINDRLSMTDPGNHFGATKSNTTTKAINHRNNGLLSRQTLLEIKVDALQQQFLIEATQSISEVHENHISFDTAASQELKSTLEELLFMFPDDWIYWQQYCNACCHYSSSSNNVLEGCTMVETFRQNILQQYQNSSTTNDEDQVHHALSFPYRGPQLLHLELALRRLLYIVKEETQTQSTEDRETYIIALIESMMQYGEIWSSRATCTYSDISPYLDQCLQYTTIDQTRKLLLWSQSMIRTNCVVPMPMDDAADIDHALKQKQRQKELRTYIFAVQIQFHIIRYFYMDLETTSSNNVEELVTWEELVQVWQSFQASDNVDQAQMESRPADELIILAVQLLLYSPKQQIQIVTQRTLDLMIAATILESAMKYSPYNPHLKICAMHVFGDLEAPTLSWELYNDLSIKHIQHESCSYLILPILRSGGMFHEAVLVCREILGLHVSSSRDVPDYIGRAMEAGNMNKAEEFLLFHRDKMTKSLTNLEAKGLILDMAPLLVNEKDGILGVQQGLVGADTDFERVKQMISEAHNPNGAFSLLQILVSLKDLKNTISDNRDFSVLSYEILWKRQFDTSDIILSESLRRGHQHNLLIRAALCIEASKGPKKGKVIKPTLESQKRCIGLIECADKTDELCSSIIPSLSNQPILLVMRELCVLIAALSSGLDSKGEFALETLSEREDVVCSALNKAVESLHIVKKTITESSEISTARICTMMADSIVPIFALFEMVAKIVDQFGWGKRKQKTKRCSAAVAEFALLFAAIVTDMRFVLDRPNSIVSLQDQNVTEQIPSVVDIAIFHTTTSNVLKCQRQVCLRMIKILDYVKARLTLFESED